MVPIFPDLYPMRVMRAAVELSRELVRALVAHSVIMSPLQK